MNLRPHPEPPTLTLVDTRQTSSPPRVISRVLFASKEEEDHELLTTLLAGPGWELRRAETGEHTLNQALAWRPDVIVLDVALPGLGAFEVHRQLQADPRTKCVPVLLITSPADRREWLCAGEAEAYDYLVKPLDHEDTRLRICNAARCKHLEDDLQRSTRELADARTLRDGLTHLILHDLRAPLSATMMSLELLKIGESTFTAQNRETIEASYQGVQTMAEVIHTLFDIERMEAGQMPVKRATTNLTTLAQRVIRSSTELASARRIRLIEPADLVEVSCECDAGLIRRVIACLVGNALKYTPPGGTVRLVTEQVDGGARCAVTDSGRGLPPESHQRIFDKFVQLDSRETRAGSGLGLCFCQLAIAAHRGQISLESEEGKGSTFCFSIPKNFYSQT